MARVASNVSALFARLRNNQRVARMGTEARVFCAQN